MAKDYRPVDKKKRYFNKMIMKMSVFVLSVL